MYLVVGLGNPGREYEGTRHNVGFEVIDYISAKLGFEVSRIKFKALMGDTNIAGEKIIFLKPGTFMNLSGISVSEAASFYKIPVENIIIVYDDISIDFGRIRIRPSGSDGGHNGMKSIIYQLGREDFPRIRVGIGGPDKNLVSYVLGKFREEERKNLPEIIKTASDAVIGTIKNGIQGAMNEYNSFRVSQE
ncbi:MAG: aminoacyl-tRNA hydrolase [Clostridiales bacterium]|jgi:PTH1 family peptidyl-tRNA hydrolase|nr:aminoacyl-tRNA hydrolase [Clostridiales bacterium]